MRTKLPILLALVLMAIAAGYWLRLLDSLRWNSSPSTVPPPAPRADIPPISNGGTPGGTVGVPASGTGGVERGGRACADKRSHDAEYRSDERFVVT